MFDINSIKDSEKFDDRGGLLVLIHKCSITCRYIGKYSIVLRDLFRWGH